MSSRIRGLLGMATDWMGGVAKLDKPREVHLRSAARRPRGLPNSDLLAPPVSSPPNFSSYPDFSSSHYPKRLPPIRPAQSNYRLPAYRTHTRSSPHYIRSAARYVRYCYSTSIRSCPRPPRSPRASSFIPSQRSVSSRPPRHRRCCGTSSSSGPRRCHRCRGAHSRVRC